MTGKVIIIEDDKEIGDLISIYLEEEGITVEHVLTGEEGLERLKSGICDLLVLDLNLPGLDGYEVLQVVRKEYNFPVVIVSARDDDADEILGFGYGADDFVKKPFSAKVLASRIRAHLRREKRSHESDNTNVITFGDFSLSIDDNILKKNKARIPLSPKEVSILIQLVQRKDTPVNQNELYKKVWGHEFGDLTTVSVHIQRLRKKIEKDPANPEFIVTVYGFGYMFKDES